MAWGAEFYNDGGVLQIAAGVSNFYMAEKGTISVGTGDNVTVTPSVAYDVIAVSPNFRMVPKSFLPTAASGGTTQSFKKDSTLTGTLNWYAFRSYKALSPASSGWGFEIYNADGTVGFSSQQPKIMRAHQKIPITGPTQFDTSLDTSKTFAFFLYGSVQGEGSRFNGMSGSTEYFPLGPAISHTSGNISIDVGIRTAKVFPSNGNTFYNGGISVIDVTGY